MNYSYRRYLYFYVVVGLARSNDPESSTGGSVATDRVSHAGYAYWDTERHHHSGDYGTRALFALCEYVLLAGRPNWTLFFFWDTGMNCLPCTADGWCEPMLLFWERRLQNRPLVNIMTRLDCINSPMLLLYDDLSVLWNYSLVTKALSAQIAMKYTDISAHAYCYIPDAHTQCVICNRLSN
jgi:hypothetical protein